MIQFNLLPDIKLDYIKAERSKRLVLSISLLVSLVAVAVLVLLFSASLLQRKHLADLNNDIKKQTSQLQNQPNLNAILTVQNQLESLTELHDQKPAVSKLFGFLNQVTPAAASINNMTVDFNAYTILLSGTADSIASVNQYVDTLKLTTITGTQDQAFSDVVLSSFSLNSNPQDASQAASYSITFSYDPTILSITQDTQLTVPTATTRAQLQSPSDLFKASATGSKQ